MEKSNRENKEGTERKCSRAIFHKTGLILLKLVHVPMYSVTP